MRSDFSLNYIVHKIQPDCSLGRSTGIINSSLERSNGDQDRAGMRGCV